MRCRHIRVQVRLWQTSADTRCKHEKTCQGPQRTREEVEDGEEEAQAKLASREETSKLDLAIISQASTSVVTKLVSGIQSNPEMVLDVNKLKLHHAIGKEATRHLRGRNIGLKLSVNPGANTLVNWFWLLRDQTVPENHNIMLMHGDPPYAVIRYENQWETRNIEEAMLTVFNSDATKLYVFLDNEANSESYYNRERVSSFRLKFVLHKVMTEALSDGFNSELFCHWKRGVAEQSHWNYMLRRLQRVLLVLWIIAVSEHLPPICKKSGGHEKWYVSYNTRKKFWWRKTCYSLSHKALMQKPELQSIPRHSNVSLTLCLNG